MGWGSGTGTSRGCQKNVGNTFSEISGTVTVVFVIVVAAWWGAAAEEVRGDGDSDSEFLFPHPTSSGLVAAPKLLRDKEGSSKGW